MELEQVSNSLLVRGKGFFYGAALILILTICAATAGARDYVTPGRGEIFDLYALAALSGGTVQYYGAYFQLNGNLTI